MEEKTIYALGFFDGVHLGHGALLKACRNLADQTGSLAGAVTFTSHPDAFVSGSAPPLINTADDRRRLLAQYQMNTILPLPFDRQMMAMPWQDFFRLMVETYHAAGMVCGHDFRFGSGGAGNGALLMAACRKAGIPCVVVPEQKIDGITISSTYIRSLLEAGDMERAAQFLGHPHILSGTVVQGHHLGHTLGFPTANLRFPDGLARPRFGVYACLALVDGAKHPAVTNIGTRPTVNGTYITVEPWLLDFQGDLYGRKITLEFYKFLRPEKKFEAISDLQAEIRKNAAQTLDFFGKT